MSGNALDHLWHKRKDGTHKRMLLCPYTIPLEGFKQDSISDAMQAITDKEADNDVEVFSADLPASDVHTAAMHETCIKQVHRPCLGKQGGQCQNLHILFVSEKNAYGMQ